MTNAPFARTNINLMHSEHNTMNIEQTRFNMIEQQIRPWEVLDGTVLRLLGQIKRELFVPVVHAAKAFVDMEVPFGAQPDQVMLAPRVEARMLQALSLQPTDSVLEIGTGTGHMAALLGGMAAQVLSLEIDPVLAHEAQNRLVAAGLGNVTVQAKDASKRLDMQFDAICVSGSLAVIPEFLKQALNVGGRLIAIVGDGPMMRATHVLRVSSSAFQVSQPWDTVAPRLRGFEVPSKFSF